MVRTDIKRNTVSIAEAIIPPTIMRQMHLEKYLDNQMQTFGIPRKAQADEKVKSGNLIWVNSYTRSDGTEVSEYYRQNETDFVLFSVKDKTDCEIERGGSWDENNKYCDLKRKGGKMKNLIS